MPDPNICPTCACSGDPGFLVREVPDELVVAFGPSTGRFLVACPECNVVRRSEPDPAVARFALWSQIEILAHIAKAEGDPTRARAQYFAAVSTGTLRVEGKYFTGSGWAWAPVPLADWAYAVWLEVPLDSFCTGFHFRADPRWGRWGDCPSQRWGDCRAPRADVERLWPAVTQRRSPPGRPSKERARVEAAMHAAIAAGQLPKSETELRVIPEKVLAQQFETSPDTAGRARKKILKSFKD